MKPFDLEAARNGAPIMYANGGEVAEWHVWKNGDIASRCSMGYTYSHFSSGTCKINNKNKNLVMAPPPMKEVTYWAVHKKDAPHFDRDCLGAYFRTKEIADKEAAQYGIALTIVQPITLKVPV